MSTTVHPARVNFSIYVGASFAEVTNLVDSEGEPVDLAGHLARMYIKRDPADTAPIYDLSTADSSITCDANGQIIIKIPALETSPALVPPLDPEGETWYYDLLITDPSVSPAKTDRLLQGIVTVLPGITPNPAP